MWLEIEEAAEMEACSERTMRRRAATLPEHQRRCVTGRGGQTGTRTQIHLSALSPAAKAQYVALQTAAPDMAVRGTAPEQTPETHLTAEAYWLTADETAQLEGVSDKTIKRWCQSGRLEKWELRADGYAVHLHSLSRDAQKRWYRRQGVTLPARLMQAQGVDDIDSRHRKEAEIWLERVMAFRAFALGYAGTEDAAADIFASGEEYTASTLKAKFRKFEKDGFRALAPQHGRKGRQQEALAPHARDFLFNHFLQSTLPSKALSARLTVKEAARMGWACPGERTLIRRLNEIPMDACVKYQQGKKAYANAIPSVRRAYDDIAPMQVWESDHHSLNVEVIFPSGKIGFPYLTAWFDMGSRYVTAWQVVIQPNSETIAYSFWLGCKAFGSPQEIHIDNGRDYKSYRLGGSQIRQRRSKTFHLLNAEQQGFLRGAFSVAGVKQIHYAIPYNAKAKTIERFWRTLNEQCVAQMPGYRGRNTTEKSEKFTEEVKARTLLTLAEFEALVSRWIREVYHQQIHEGDGMEKRTPEQVFSTRSATRYVPEENLRLLLMKLGKERVIQKNGIEMWNQFYRLDPALHLKYKGQRVWVRYDPRALDALYLYDYSGDTYIGVANVCGKAKWTDEDAIKRQREEQKRYTMAMADYFERQEVKMVAQMTPAERIGLSPNAPETPAPSGKRGSDGKVVGLVPRIDGRGTPPCVPGDDEGSHDGQGSHGGLPLQQNGRVFQFHLHAQEETPEEERSRLMQQAGKLAIERQVDQVEDTTGSDLLKQLGDASTGSATAEPEEPLTWVLPEPEAPEEEQPKTFGDYYLKHLTR